MATAEHGGINTGWRIFQLIALVTAVSWLFSYIVWGNPLGRLDPVWLGWVLSPIVSLFIIGIAVVPERMNFLNQRNAVGYLARGLILVIAAWWMLQVFISTPMAERLFADPMGQAGVLPMAGGVFFHVVFQHWFQGVAAIAMALAPKKFSILTESPTPAGIQCAVVDCA